MRMKSIFFAFLFVLSITVSVFAQNDVKRVLVIHSYHANSEWVSTVSQGLRNEFQNQEDLEFEILYMDTKRNTTEKWKKHITTVMKDAVSVWNPQVLILIDDNAQDLLGRVYAGKKSPYIVFGGMNGTPDYYGYDKADNVTGIMESIQLAKTLELFKKINPAAKKIAVMSDDSFASKMALSFIKKEAEKTEYEFVAFDSVDTFANWKDKVRQYEKEVDAIFVYTCHTLENKKGTKYVKPKRVLKWMRNKSRVPFLGAFSFTVDNGGICAVAESALEHGTKTAKIAKALLEGESISKFPISYAIESISVLNLSEAEKKGFTVDQSLIDGVDMLIAKDSEV